MENRLEILEGLKAAKTAFQETLDLCKKDGVGDAKIFDFASCTNTDRGICYFLTCIYSDEAHKFTCDFFDSRYLTSTICYIRPNDCNFKEKSIKSVTKRVEWLEAKIKELEDMD